MAGTSRTANLIFQPDLETMPPTERAKLQGERLHDLVARLKACGSAFWSDKLAGVDPDAIRTIDDLSMLPFTTKAEFREQFPFGMLAVPLKDTVRVHASSGTRGKPTVVAYTRGDVQAFAETNARCLAAAGAAPEDVIHVAYGYGLFTGGLGFHYGVEALGATAVPASAGNPGFQVQLMSDLGASGLCCTPSFAMLLAEQAAADGLLEQMQVRYGVLGAEPWSDAFRNKLEEAWGAGGGEFDACDIYGLSEVMGPGVAVECRQSKGAMFLFDDHFYPEIVDPETGDPVAPGQYGELVLTTLTKEAVPAIRYRSGDLTRFVDDACPSGRTHPRIDRLQGRVDDMLIIRGVNVFPKEIEAALLEDPAVGGQYVIIVDCRSTLPQLEVRAELASADDLPRLGRVADRLERRLRERVRLRVGITLGAPGSVPRQEIGKARRVFQWNADEPDPFPVVTDSGGPDQTRPT
jgi:phenylacetate-CoA ligase